ncbi:MAG: YicC family protein [Planctomycetaceae bacterium]|nr:YicC family protein [Planctomycetaceae bacterium]MBT6488043.1 YicC family protein [Planctomycetaceae bacterium]MBT6497817.1 YicC family protein [Planctomycetaceae bacterium]
MAKTKYQRSRCVADFAHKLRPIFAEQKDTDVLLSMTGFGDARTQTERSSIAIEVRSVNNRYLKISSRIPDAYAAVESDIEKVIRSTITRGTVNVTLRVKRLHGGQEFRLDHDVLSNYWQQMNELASSMHLAMPSHLGDLLQLPGIVSEAETESRDSSQDWPAIKAALIEALEKLCAFRKTEGEAMQRDLQANAAVIAEQLGQVAEQAPEVVAEYRSKLLDRVREMLDSASGTVEDSHLLREVSIFADKCDINEEITRLRSHLEQFEAFLQPQKSQGRKLEFLSQEIFREVNTIGSKANDVTIAHAVVEMKAAVEKLREVLQNVE